MSGLIVKFIYNRLLRDNQWNKFGVEDPYYEYVPIHLDASGNPNKYKRVPRRIPDGISENDYKILNQVKKKAYRYDMWFNIFGIKLGWTNIVGVIPVFGTIVSSYWSINLYVISRKLDDGLPLDIQLLFFINIAIDFLLLLIPIVGDLIEIGYKANLRNFLLVEKHLVKVGEKNMGLISPEEVRPNFINDKIQPLVDETIKPGAVKAGESIKSFVKTHLNSPNGSRSRSISDSSDASSVFASKSPTIQTTPTSVTTSFVPYDEKRKNKKLTESLRSFSIEDDEPKKEK